MTSFAMVRALALFLMVFWAAATGGGAAVWAAPVFEVRADVPRVSLTRQVGVALDVPAEWGLLDVLAVPQRFVQWKENDLNLGIRRLPTWVRLEVSNPSDRPVSWVLDVGDGLVEWMRLHEVSSDGRVRERTTGTSLPWATRDPPGHRFTFRMEEPPRSTRTVYLEIRSGFSQRLTMKAHQPEDHQALLRENWMGHGLYFGVVVGLAAYHLVLFLLLRDLAFLSYCGLLVATMVSRALFWGFGFESIWPEGSEVYAAWHGVPFGVGHILGIAFTLKVLNLKRYAPGGRWLLLVLGPAYGLWLTLGFVMPTWLTVTGFYIGAVSIQISLMGVGAVAWWRGDRAGRWFVPAWASLILGVHVWILANLGFIPSTDWMIWAAPIGISINAVLLATALAARVRDAEQVQIESERRRAAEQEAANRALEQRVRERTEELSSAKDRAEHADRLKDLFVRLVSHDLRSPLASIMAAADRVEGAHHALASGIRQTAAGLIRLIDRLLDLDVLSTGRMMLRRSYLPARQLAQPALHALQALADSRQITLRNELPADLQVFGDPTLLGEVLGNLLGNAVKFGRPGDTVTLTVDADGRSLVVLDTGPGFAATRQARGARLDVSGVGAADTGLGLRYSGEIMLAHGGRIEVDERVAAGARVVMRLPPRGAVVLVADDQPAQRQLIAEWVRQAWPQSTVVEADDGQQAWEQLEGVRPDLLVADVQMPVRDGLDLVRALRDDVRWQQLPVLMVSASGHDQRGRSMEAACLEAGADAFLTKPLSPETFVPLMKTLMQPIDEMTEAEEMPVPTDAPSALPAVRRAA